MVRLHLHRATATAIALLSVGLMAPAQQGPRVSGLPDAPGEPVAKVSEIRALIDGGQAGPALQQLDKLKASSPNLPGLDRLRGIALYSENRFAEADAAFVSAIKLNPHDEEAIQMRGLALFRSGKPGEAIPLLETAHDWNAETKTDPSYVLALCYIDARRFDDARHAFAAQYGFPPDSAAAYLLAARMLLRREYVPVAKEFATKAVELDPALPLTHVLLGEIALAGEHVQEAIAEFEKERKRNPLEASSYDRLGDAYTRAGDYTKAQQVLQQAILLEPSSTGPYILLGKTLLKRQDAANAAMYLERAAKMDPSNSMTHNLLGQAYRQLGRADEAKQQSEIAQRIRSGNEPRLESIK
jgi:predicted Zn-dependent protease